MNKTLNLKCPHCRLKAKAVLDGSFHKFIVYTCPKCKSNVVYFKNKIDIIPNYLFRKLLKRRKLVFCGDVSFSSPEENHEPCTRGPITLDDITNLKILLETEKDSSSVISRL